MQSNSISGVAFCEMRKKVDRYIRAPRQEKLAIGGDIFLIVDCIVRIFERSAVSLDEIPSMLDVLGGMLDLKDEDLSSPIKQRLAELKKNFEARLVR